MYARSLVEARIEIAQRELGFDLEYHSTSEIDDFQTRMEEKYPDSYTQARRASQGGKDTQSSFQTGMIRSLSEKLSSEEIRFIRNERALSMCDASYFLERYFWIKTPAAIQRFTYLPGQRVYFNVISEIEDLGFPIELICCKARQHGISTLTEGLMVHRVNFGYGVNAVVASADQTKTSKMAQMTFLGYDMLPWWMAATSTRRVESNAGMLVFGELRSGISFQHGSQTSGIARGDTVKLYHLSEVASYTNPEYQIEASLDKCVHPYPDVFGVLESTAEGDTGWFADTYWFSKREWLTTRKARRAALFLPWFLGTDKYPTPTWIRTHPVPRDWNPEDETHAMMQRAQEYIRTSDVLQKVLGTRWTLPREQAWWWECTFLEARAKGTEKLHYQEYPTDDREAFQSSYDNVFGREVIAEIESRRKTEYDAYAIVGQSIEEDFEPEPEEIDEDARVVPVSFYNRVKEKTYKWEFQPVFWEEPFRSLEDIKAESDKHLGKLFVYHRPEPGYDYAIGIRTGNGIGSGQTAIAVSRRGRDPQEIDVQAAEFRSMSVSHVDAYAFALSIAAYYSQYLHELPKRVKFDQPYVSMEQVESVGDIVFQQMHKMGYRRFHKMRRYDTDPKHNKIADSRKVGWFNFGWARPIFMDTFVSWVRCGWYKLNSPYSIWEADHWEQKTTTPGKAKYIASENSSDEGLLANALAAFCVNDTAAMAERTTKRNYEGRSHKPKLDITPTPAGTAFPLSALYNTFDESKLRGWR